MLSRYKVTSLKPDKISTVSLIKDSFELNNKKIYPRIIDNRELCLPTGDQKSTSYCTGFATAGYFEVKQWRLTHYPKQFDAELIYKSSKKIDNLPSDGSYIECAMTAAINLGYNKLINKTENLIKISNSIECIKQAIHEDDIFVGAFMVTDEWNKVTKNGYISNSSNYRTIGGHAVLVCGYDDTGLWIQNSWGVHGWGSYGFGHLSWNQVKIQFKYGIRLQ